MAGNPTLPTENIDKVILRLLVLEPNEIDELDYETYRSYLKELLVEITSGRKIDSGEASQVSDEYKRIKGKKGRFKISSKKSKATSEKLGLGTIRKTLTGTQKRLMLAPVGGVPKQTQQPELQKKETDTGILVSISKTLDSILSTLTNINSQNRARFERERRDAESRKRTGREKELESRPIEGIKKVISAVTKPFQSIWDKIVNFITNIILGRIVLKLIDWIADPKNQGKIQSIIRFFKDHWPVLLALYLRFGTGIGRFIGKLGGILIRGAFKLAGLAAKLALKAGIGKAGGRLSKFAGFIGGPRGKAVASVLGIAADAAVTYGASKSIEGFAGGNQEKSQPTQKFSGGGAVRLPSFSGGGFNFKGMMSGAGMGAMFGPLGMLLGGALGSGKPQEIFSGLVSGPGGPKGDKIPAMLSDGEFVMSAGAVQKYGVDTLEGMNAAGGGTNKPKVVGETTYAAGGGYIEKVSHHLKQDEALSSLTKGTNDYIKPGGNSIKTGKKWNLITSKTPIHSYIDSVGQPTIGWGSTYYDSILNGKKPVKLGDTIIKSQADNILNTNIMNLGKEYSKKIPTWNKMSEDQKAGVTLVGYNAPYGPIGAYRNLTSALAKGDMVRASTEVQRGGPSPSRISLERKLILSGPKDLSKVNPEPKKPSSSQPQKKSGFNLSNMLGYLPKFQKGGEIPERPLPNISLGDRINRFFFGESKKNYDPQEYKMGGMIGENSGSNYGPDGKKLSGPDRQYFSYFAQPGESRYIFTKKATERGAVDQANNIQALLDPRSKAATDVKKSSSPALSSNQRIRSAVKPLPRSKPKPYIPAGGGMGGMRGSGANPSRSGSKPPSQSPTHRRGTITSASAYGIMR